MNSTIIVGLIAAFPILVGVYLTYRASMKRDEAAKQEALAAGQATSLGQVIDGLNSIIAALQGDNKVLREVAALREVKGRIVEIEKANGNGK